MIRRKLLILTAAAAASLLIYSCGKAEKQELPATGGESFRMPAETVEKGVWADLSADPELGAWIMADSGAWKAENGVMSKSEGGGNIWTKRRYGNFELECEFKIETGGNSGIFFRTDDIDDPVQTGIEMQVYNTPRQPSPVKNDCGAIYDFMEPSEYADKPPGEWNHVIITCDDNIITVVLNGVEIITMDIDRWDTPGMNPDGTKNKFNNALKDFSRLGHIGFQEHGDPVWFRNVRVKEL